MQKVDKEKTRYYLAKIHILFRGNFRTQGVLLINEHVKEIGYQDIVF